MKKILLLFLITCLIVLHSKADKLTFYNQPNSYKYFQVTNNFWYCNYSTFLLKDPKRRQEYDLSSNYTWIETTSLALKRKRIGVELLFSLFNNYDAFSGDKAAKRRMVKDLLGLTVGYFGDEFNYFIEFQNSSFASKLNTYSTNSGNLLETTEFDSGYTQIDLKMVKPFINEAAVYFGLRYRELNLPIIYYQKSEKEDVKYNWMSRPEIKNINSYGIGIGVIRNKSLKYGQDETKEKISLSDRFRYFIRPKFKADMYVAIFEDEFKIAEDKKDVLHYALDASFEIFFKFIVSNSKHCKFDFSLGYNLNYLCSTKIKERGSSSSDEAKYESDFDVLHHGPTLNFHFRF